MSALFSPSFKYQLIRRNLHVFLYPPKLSSLATPLQVPARAAAAAAVARALAGLPPHERFTLSSSSSELSSIYGSRLPGPPVEELEEEFYEEVLFCTPSFFPFSQRLPGYTDVHTYLSGGVDAGWKQKGLVGWMTFEKSIGRFFSFFIHLKVRQLVDQKKKG